MDDLEIDMNILKNHFTIFFHVIRFVMKIQKV